MNYDLQKLHSSAGVSQLPHALPLVRLVRGATAAESRYETYWGDGVPGTAPSHAQGLDGLGSRRTVHAHAVSQGDWAGAMYGIRAPEPEETPLSWSEVRLARRFDVRGVL